MELQGSMEGNHRVVGELRGQKVRVYRCLCGLQSRGDHGVEAAADMDEVAGGHMLLEGGLTRHTMMSAW
jgi:hypothetical protein